MANLTQTAASVAKGTGAAIEKGKLAGETITAGNAVYLKTSDDRWYLAQFDGTSAESGSDGLGIALHGSLAGQPIAVQTAGEINVGATMVVGTWYGLSATLGAIAPVADQASTNYPSILGIAKAATNLLMHVSAIGVAKA